AGPCPGALPCQTRRDRPALKHAGPSLPIPRSARRHLVKQPRGRDRGVPHQPLTPSPRLACRLEYWPMAIRRAACRAILSAALMGLAGCTTAAPRAAPTSTPSTVADCISADEQSADGVGLPADNGRHADGVILGSGETGVVLANQVNDDLCTWKTVLGDELTD